MKLVLIVFCFSVFGVYGQQVLQHINWCFDKIEENEGYECEVIGYYDFENLVLLEIDSTDSNNVWQVGPPKKSILDSAASNPNVIITDTMSPYPTEDTSSFIIVFVDISIFISFYTHTFSFTFDYFVDSDSLQDYGLIEFSPDNGEMWINLIDDTSNYSNLYNWDNDIPVLTGQSFGWNSSEVEMMSLLHQFYSISAPTDTMLLRFTFISDEIQTNRDGLMFDNLQIETMYLNTQEYKSPSQEKEVVKVLDLLGRETQVEPNRVLIYVYSDGTREKKVVSDW